MLAHVRHRGYKSLQLILRGTQVHASLADRGRVYFVQKRVKGDSYGGIACVEHCCG